MNSPIVTLTTDWGEKDFFCGMVKGKLYSYIPNVRVVDITHGIDPFNLTHASFVVKNACLGFPAGTIHIIDVDTVETEENAFVVVKYNDQYYICTDNGLPAAVFGTDFQSVTQLRVNQDSNFFTFAAHDLFCKVAALLAAETPLTEMGEFVPTLNPASSLGYVVSDDVLKVYITYIDNYGNAYLSITYEKFMEILNHRNFKMYVTEFVITNIANSYIDTSERKSRKTEMLLTVSSTGYMQIALKRASAAQLAGLNFMDAITIKFFDK